MRRGDDGGRTLTLMRVYGRGGEGGGQGLDGSSIRRHVLRNVGMRLAWLLFRLLYVSDVMSTQ